VASGVRRIEGLTGPGAYAHLRAREQMLHSVAELVKSPMDGVERRVHQLLDERRALEKKVEEAMKGGSGGVLTQLIADAQSIGNDGAKLVVGEVSVPDAKSLQALGDLLREQLRSGIAVLGARLEDGKASLLAVVTDDMRERGFRADAIVRDVAAVAGGRGGGKPHMAQAGVPDASRLADALAEAPRLVNALVSAS
jgi:alanyl-tRNA synthetase